MTDIAGSDHYRKGPVVDDLPPPVGETIHSNVERIMADAKGLVAAERAYWKARIKYSRSLAKQTALLFGAAIALAASAFTALILGLLLVLSVSMGPMGATIVVFASTLILAAALAWLALRKARKLTFSTPDPSNPLPAEQL